MGDGWGPGPSAALSAPQKMVESQRQNVLAEFERLRRLLAEEEQRLLQRLEEEELEVLPPLRESAARLGQQSTQLAELIADLEGRCQLPALGLLQVSWGVRGGGGSGSGWGQAYAPEGRKAEEFAMERALCALTSASPTCQRWGWG